METNITEVLASMKAIEAKEKADEEKITISKVVEIEITKDDFEDYVAVQMSGVTNMFAISTVCELSGLSRDKVKAIMNNYSKLQEKYSKEVN